MSRELRKLALERGRKHALRPIDNRPESNDLIPTKGDSMFQLGQIIRATQLVKKFTNVASHIRYNPEPVEILQKGRDLIVFG